MPAVELTELQEELVLTVGGTTVLFVTPGDGYIELMPIYKNTGDGDPRTGTREIVRAAGFKTVKYDTEGATSAGSYVKLVF